MGTEQAGGWLRVRTDARRQVSVIRPIEPGHSSSSSLFAIHSGRGQGPQLFSHWRSGSYGFLGSAEERDLVGDGWTPQHESYSPDEPSAVGREGHRLE